MMSMTDIRSHRLTQLSQMIVDGQITHKIDQIATIYINGRHYFNVFRRYNSAYNIVIEDSNNDIYLHQDYTVRKSLQTIMCLPDYDAANIYTWNATSFKHNGPVPSLTHDIADMRWTDIQGHYQAVSVNFGGIYYDYVPRTPQVAAESVYDDCPSTPRDQIRSTPTTPPGAPERPVANEQPISDVEAANILLTLSMPTATNAFILRECDGPTLSMRFADIKKRKQDEHISCYCQMNTDDESEDDENNYTVLRSGTHIPKVFAQ